MKIIKHGKRLSEPRFYFKCPKCGCEFEAMENELKYIQQSLVYVYISNMECPECNYLVTGEKIYE